MAEWKLVPVEPDGRMWSTGRAEFIRAAQQYEDARSAEKASIVGDVAGSDIYRAMLRASPPPVTAAREVVRSGFTDDMMPLADQLWAAREQEASATGAEPAWSGRIIEIDYETHRAIVRYEGNHPIVGDDLFATPTTSTTGKVDASRVWQPIETAPVDVLVLLSDIEFPSSDGKPPVKVGGYWDWKWHIFGASWKPTHWMPLPEPPVGTPKSAEGEGA